MNVFQSKLDTEGNSSFRIYELKGIVFIEGLVTILAKTEGNSVKIQRIFIQNI